MYLAALGINTALEIQSPGGHGAVLYHKIAETEIGVRSKIQWFSFTGTHSLL